MWLVVGGYTQSDGMWLTIGEYTDSGRMWMIFGAYESGLCDIVDFGLTLNGAGGGV